jgi:hypothetical protein
VHVQQLVTTYAPSFVLPVLLSIGLVLVEFTKIDENRRPQVTIATAIVFCHRFFHRQSHKRNDRYVSISSPWSGLHIFRKWNRGFRQLRQ